MFGVTNELLVSLGALIVLGAGDMVSVYIRHLLVQFETPDDIRGRVSAVNSVFIGASNELGEFESGVTAGWVGDARGGDRRLRDAVRCARVGDSSPSCGAWTGFRTTRQRAKKTWSDGGMEGQARLAERTR